VFFIDGQGRAVFQDRHSPVRRDVPGHVRRQRVLVVAAAVHTTLQPDYDVTRIVNEVKVTATGGTTQTATDDVSRQKFFRRTLSLTPALTTDTAALDQARTSWRSAEGSGSLRFDSLKVVPSAERTCGPYALGLELGRQGDG
jgi:hypothetical protein